MAKRDNKIAIAQALSDGEFHSGEHLGKALGISRMAVANHVKSLNALGLDIFSVTGKGYKLSESLSMLSAAEIENEEFKGKVEVHSIIDSTNAYLSSLIRNKQSLADGYSVIAECQTAGRGRRGRQWQSPFGSHIYFSQYRMMEDGLAAAAGLSLAVGIAVKRACEELVNIELELKWPNDILVEGKKLAGILVEAEGQSDGACHLVIGIGININMPEQFAEQIDQPWTDLNTLASGTINRNRLVRGLLKHLDSVYDEYQSNRLDNLVDEWNAANAHKDKPVKVISTSNEKRGKCLGIDQTGALLLEQAECSTVLKIYGGEVSLRVDNAKPTN